jgi:hypothetical protein
MENLPWQAQSLAHAGISSLPLAPDVPVVFVAAGDIGGHAGRRLLDGNRTGTTSHEVFGTRPVSCAKAAKVISGAWGRTVRCIPPDSKAWALRMRAHGLSLAMTKALVERFEDIATGHDRGGTPARPLPCTTTLEAWTCKVLAPLVQGIQ